MLIDGNVGNSDQTQHRGFAIVSGEICARQFTSFLTRATKNLSDHNMNESIHFICIDRHHLTEILAAGQSVYDALKNLKVWAKATSYMGMFYRSRHALTFIFKKRTTPHINTFELRQHGCYRANVRKNRGVKTMPAGWMEEVALHPTVKPVHMSADTIRGVSGRRYIVPDLFGRSGSTLIAADIRQDHPRLFACDQIHDHQGGQQMLIPACVQRQFVRQHISPFL